MILTDDFVFLHPPKTGGTFAGAMIHRLYPDRRRQLLERLRGVRPLGRPARQEVHKHAPRHRIPASHAHLPVPATVRSPYESYVSTYEFKEWAKGRRNPEFASYDWDRIEADFPAFPQLSFADFLTVLGRVGYRIDTPDRPDLGWAGALRESVRAGTCSGCPVTARGDRRSGGGADARCAFHSYRESQSRVV